MDAKIDYAEMMFTEISKLIENTGKGDAEYTDKAKAIDILNVLESLLSYTIYTTCLTTDDVRDASEDSYMSIKKQAIDMIRKNPPKAE